MSKKPAFTDAIENGRRVRLTPCPWRRRYFERAEAEEVCRLSRRPLAVEECGECGGFHLRWPPKPAA